MKTPFRWFVFLSLISILASPSWAQDEAPRNFTDAGGTASIMATVVSIQGDQVELKRSDGKTFVLPINRLGVDDALYLKEWQQKNPGKQGGQSSPSGAADLQGRLPRLSIAVYTGKTSKKDDQIAGFYDEKKQKLAFGVELENEERALTKIAVRAVLWVFGTSLESGRDAVVYKEVLPPVELLLYKAIRQDAKSFELWYDDIDAVYGFKYSGYVVVIQDSKGAILGNKTIPGSASRYLENVLKLEAGDEFNKRYEKVDTVGRGMLEQSVRMR